MVTTSVTSAARQQNTSRPPSFSGAAHLRSLWGVALPAAILGAVVGIVVFITLTATSTTQYRSDVVAQSHGSTAAPYLALATDGGVLADVKTRTGYTGTLENLLSAISVSAGTSPELLDVSSRASTSEFAKALSLQMISSLNDALQTNYRATSSVPNPADNQLALLSVPVDSGSLVATHALWPAVISGVVAALVFAEILIALAGRFGSKISRAWTRRTSRKYGVSMLQAGPAQDGLPPSVLVNLRRHAAQGHRVLVLSGPGVELEKISTGDKSSAKKIRTAHLDEPWWSGPGAEEVRFVVASVVEGNYGKSEAVRTLETVHGAGIPATLVVHSARDGNTSVNDARAFVWGAPMVPEPVLKKAVAAPVESVPAPVIAIEQQPQAPAVAAMTVVLTKPAETAPIAVESETPVDDDAPAKVDLVRHPKPPVEPDAWSLAEAERWSREDAEARIAEEVRIAAELRIAEEVKLAEEAAYRRPPTFDEFGASVSLDDIGNEFVSFDGSHLPGLKQDEPDEPEAVAVVELAVEPAAAPAVEPSAEPSAVPETVSAGSGVTSPSAAG